MGDFAPSGSQTVRVNGSPSEYQLLWFNGGSLRLNPRNTWSVDSCAISGLIPAESWRWFLSSRDDGSWFFKPGNDEWTGNCSPLSMCSVLPARKHGSPDSEDWHADLFHLFFPSRRSMPILFPTLTRVWRTHRLFVHRQLLLRDQQQSGIRNP